MIDGKGDRTYSEHTFDEMVGIITEEVFGSGESFGWTGDVPTPIKEELANRGIELDPRDPERWLRSALTMKPDSSGTENLINQAMLQYRGGETGPFTPREFKEFGESCFKLGNKKLGKDTIVFNMTSGHDCPSKGHCECRTNCYATADEMLWKTPLAYRRRQNAYWDKVTVDEFMRHVPIPTHFRFSESGDFRSQKDVDKMVEIAKRLKEERGVITYGYTNRYDLDFTELSKVAVLNGHGFMLGNKTCVKDDVEPGDRVCPGDCRYCDWCKVATGMTIVFPRRNRAAEPKK